MKIRGLISLVSILFICYNSFSQNALEVTSRINYQFSVWDKTGAVVKNQPIGVEISILKGSEKGTILYTETHIPTTNANGLATIEIGGGTNTFGNYNTIDWDPKSVFYLSTKVRLPSEKTYSISGVSKFLSVPYSLYSKKSGNGIASITDNNNGTLTFNFLDGSKYISPVLKGITGPQGIKGDKGDKGDTGAQGLKGDKGDVGPIGLTGATGANGTNGVNGQNTLVKTTTEAVGANCSTGGVKVEYGLDANNNGILDVNEINLQLTKYVCNGSVGVQGIQGPQGVAGAPGAQGPIGLTGATGPKGDVGLQGLKGDKGDVGATGLTGATGPAGANGINTLVKTTTELAGVNCTTGGVKVEYGLDVNNNGTLDAAEINTQLTKYVCNGAVGAQGPTGLTGANGTNGSNGVDGKNTLVKTTTESAGVNCSTGGVKVEYGLDANNNGTLDVSEININLTKYLCNGAVGAQGIQGPQGLAGAPGAQGPIGLIGATGPKGDTGVPGKAGANGTNTLVKTTTEVAGTNCATGGVKLEYGLDANNNGILEEGEINILLSKYVCNGIQGIGVSSMQILNDSLFINYTNNLTQNLGRLNITNSHNINSVHGFFTSKISGTWIVPDGINQINIVFNGSGGGKGGDARGPYDRIYIGGSGGLPAFFSMTLDVNNGDSINYVIGSDGVDGTSELSAWFGKYKYGGNGTDSGVSSLSINNKLIFTLIGGSGGTGACGGCTNNGGSGMPGSPGANGLLELNNFDNSGILNYSVSNILNIPSSTIMIRY